jgi:hypothetical protein
MAAKVKDCGVVFVERLQQVIGARCPTRAKPQLLAELSRTDLILDRAALLAELQQRDLHGIGGKKQDGRLSPRSARVLESSD